MKVFYFGSVIDNESFNRTVNNSKVKPSASAQNFEMALVKGLAAQPDIDLTVVSAESIATFPRSHKLLLSYRKVAIAENVFTSVIGALNIPLFKALGHRIGLSKKLIRWLKDNKDDANKVVICYGLYSDVCKSILKYTRKYCCMNCCVVTDIPALTLQYNHPKNRLKNLILKFNAKKATKIQGLFDTYVYLTEGMSNIVSPQKPYVVVETIADVNIFDGLDNIEKANPKAIMYAGTLCKGYGIDLIVDAFMKLKGDYQLWLFGSGDYEREIKEVSLRDSRIKFFGRVTRLEVLKREKEATLLINLRNPQDEYTKYSFPSKLVEYMLSGTPVITTKLQGIPNEYDDYLFYTNYSSDIASRDLDSLLKNDSLDIFGLNSAEFAKRFKNNIYKATIIYNFLKSKVGKKYDK